MKNSVFLLVCAGLLLQFADSHAQVTDCTDPDGDGWGFSNTAQATCRPIEGANVLHARPSFQFEGLSARVTVAMDVNRPMRLHWWPLSDPNAVQFTNCQADFEFGAHNETPHTQSVPNLVVGERYGLQVMTSQVAGAASDRPACGAMAWEPVGEVVEFQLPAGNPVAIRVACLTTRRAASESTQMWAGSASEAILRLENIPATSGTEVCFAVRAVRISEGEADLESPFSDEACIVVPEVVPDNPVAVTKPGTPALSIVYESAG